MRIPLLIVTVLTSILFSSCSSGQKRNSISISPASSGIVRSHDVAFPLYLTNKIESRESVINKTSPNVFIVHTGHILSATATKAQNEAVLASLAGAGIDVVNLTIEDFIIADQQSIAFEKYPQRFLNSSVLDLNEDNIVKRPNITPYILHDGVGLIGLSDKDIDELLSMEKFMVSDYVLSVLQARQAAFKESATSGTPGKPVQTFIIVHTIGAEINEVMERLPPNFLNSLAN